MKRELQPLKERSGYITWTTSVKLSHYGKMFLTKTYFFSEKNFKKTPVKVSNLLVNDKDKNAAAKIA